jgi:class 3 adenylate cyclase
MTGASPRVQRRLAAILAADVVGYSALMSQDEEGTHDQIRALQREVIKPAVEQHQGRVVKTTGDGFLIEFASLCRRSGVPSLSRRHLEMGHSSSVLASTWVT